MLTRMTIRTCWTGNTPRRVGVMPHDAPSASAYETRAHKTKPLERGEDPTTTTLMTPVTMSHVGENDTDGWVEPSEELQGTAVFDATGDRTAMPS